MPPFGEADTKPVEKNMTKKTTKKADTKPVEKKASLVDMVNGEKKAEVHPLEVENYELGGWSKSK